MYTNQYTKFKLQDNRWGWKGDREGVWDRRRGGGGGGGGKGRGEDILFLIQWVINNNA